MVCMQLSGVGQSFMHAVVPVYLPGRLLLFPSTRCSGLPEELTSCVFPLE